MLIEHTETLDPLHGRDDYYTSRYPILYCTVKCSRLAGLELRLGYDDNQKRFLLSWGADGTTFEPISISGGEIRVDEWSGEEGKSWVIPFGPSKFPFVPRASLSGPVMNCRSQSARITIKLHLTGTSTVPEIALIASSMTASLRTRNPSNICFYFPRTRQRLWANEEVLCNNCPYFRTLFSSGFSETTFSAPDSSPKKALPPYTYEDSDAEDAKSEDSAVVNKQEEEEEEKRTEAFPFKTITIVDTSYTTYLAVLLWISTRFISFAPLFSSFLSETVTIVHLPAARQLAINKLKSESKPGLPDPVSPKSVYRLAHLLELPELASLALENYKSQLTPSGAFYELYGDVSCTYPEVQEVAMKYVVENWDKVKGTKSVKAIETKAENGEATSAMALIGIRLAKRLVERYVK